MASFRYDAEGNRTVREVAGLRTVAVDEGYEVRGGVARKVYRLGGEAVAVREGSTVWAVVGDHLDSVTVLAQSGSPMGVTRYLPNGAIWVESGAFSTDRRFTGQREEAALGLSFYNARWYDPALGRFISADTIVPEPGNPQGLNRYSYVYNNPLRYVDPSGYDPLDEAWEQEFEKQNGRPPNDLDRLYRLYSIAYPGPASGGWPWTMEDWIYLSEHHNEVFQDTSHRSSLEDFTAAIQRISGWYREGEEAQFVSGLALLYAGWPYDPTGNNVYEVSIPNFSPIDVCGGVPNCGKRYYVNHGMVGFSDLYHYQGIENTHHWAGHLLFAYHEGAGVNMIIVRIREVLQNDPDRRADIRMGDLAGGTARALRRGFITIATFAAAVFQSLRVR